MISNEENNSSNAANSWVICDSKSRPGLKYYFNLVTGEAVWDISDGVVEKTPNITKQFVKQGKDSAKYPEPNYKPPMDQPWNIRTAAVYNKQIINNQFPDQLSNICSLLRSGALGSAQTPSIFIVPTAPIVGHIQPIPQGQEINRNPCGNYSNSYQYETNRNDKTRNKNRKYFNNKFKKRFNKWHPNLNWEKDLRQKLVRKRSISESNSEELEQNAFSNSEHHHEFSKQKSNDIPDATTIDLTPLKQTTLAEHSKIEQWFIVVDIDVILNQFRFFNNLIGVDQNCFIVVPYHVYKELEMLANKNNCVSTRRILRFLIQQIECDLVSLGKEINNPNVTVADKTFGACLSIVDDSKYVVLVSNNPEIAVYKNSHKCINIMTTIQFISILKNSAPQLPRIKSPTLDIKIIVPNSSNASNTSDVEPIKTEFNLQSDETDIRMEIDNENDQILEEKSQDSVSQHIDKGQQRPQNKSQLYRSISEQTPVEAKTNDIINESKRYKWRKRCGSLTNVSESKTQNENTDKTTSDKTNTNCNSPNKSSICSDTNKSQVNSDIEKCSNKSIKINAECLKTTVFDSKAHTSTPKPKEKTLLTIKRVTMFEIENQTMEETLKTRSDEWISRFVQIMEEVLKFKLQEDPPFQSNNYPPPWTLQEAAKCIIKKYSDYFNVVDAANNLSFILYKVSDEKDNIGMNMEPSEYMEMYSYGVYLIDTLMDVSKNCEELNLASESLKNLLHDIKNALSYNDTFVDDEHNDTVMKENNTQIDGDKLQDEETSLSPQKTTQKTVSKTQKKSEEISKSPINVTPKTKRLYNLRSSKKIKIQSHDTTDSTSTNIDNAQDFFSNLNLLKSPVSKHTDSSSSTSILASPQTQKSVSPLKPPIANEKEDSNNLNISSSNEEENINTIQPKIVRNFIKFDKFEEKLKNSVVDDCHDIQDYEYDYEGSSDEYCGDDEEYNDDDCQDKLPVKIREIPERNDSPAMFDTKIESETNLDAIKPCVTQNTDTEISELNSIPVNFVRNFLNYVTKNFDKVRLFCEEQLSKRENIDCAIRNKAEKISNAVQSILKHLESIHKTEHESPDSIESLLKKANLEIDKNSSIKYRKMVALYIEQAKLFIDLLKLISNI